MGCVIKGPKTSIYHQKPIRTAFEEQQEVRLCCGVNTRSKLARILVHLQLNRLEGPPENYMKSENVRSKTHPRFFVNFTRQNHTGPCDDSVSLVEMCLLLRRASVSDSGNFSCNVFHWTWKRFTIGFVVTKKDQRWIVYTMTLSVVVAMAIVTIGTFWMLYYDFLLMLLPARMRSRRRKKNNEDIWEKKTECDVARVLFVYGQDCERGLKMAMTISDDLEHFGLETYLIDRDQTFGRGSVEEIIKSLNLSALCVFVLSPETAPLAEIGLALRLVVSAAKHRGRALFVMDPSRDRVHRALLLASSTSSDECARTCEEIHQMASAPQRWAWRGWQHSCLWSRFWRRRMIGWIAYHALKQPLS